MALAHVRDPYPPMHSRAPDQPVPAHVEAVVRRCMEKSPARRYQDCDELLHAFAEAIEFVGGSLTAQRDQARRGAAKGRHGV